MPKIVDKDRRYGIFIDPGSRETGWCLAEPLDDFELRIIDAGTITYRPELGGVPMLRIDDIRRRLMRFMDALDPSPSEFVIEVTSGKVNRARHKGGGAGLAVYGVAVGALWTMGLMWSPSNRPPDAPRHRVVPIPENIWKGGFGKFKSAHVAKKYMPDYDPANDPEFNVADAVAFAVWYYTAWARKQAKAKAEEETIRDED